MPTVSRLAVVCLLTSIGLLVGSCEVLTTFNIYGGATISHPISLVTLFLLDKCKMHTGKGVS